MKRKYLLRHPVASGGLLAAACAAALAVRTGACLADELQTLPAAPTPGTPAMPPASTAPPTPPSASHATPAPTPGPPSGIATPPIPVVSLPTTGPALSPAPQQIKSDAPPYTDRGVTMVSLQPLCTFLETSDEMSDGIVTLTKAFPQAPAVLRTVTFRIGGDSAQVQDAQGRRSVRFPLPPEQRLGSVFVPLRVVVGLLGAKIERLEEGGVAVIRSGDKVGILTPIAQEGYRGADAARLTILNRVGRALSIRLSGPQSIAVELGVDGTVVRSVRPGVYYYQAAARGMQIRSGGRRLLPKSRATWAWGRH